MAKTDELAQIKQEAEEAQALGAAAQAEHDARTIEDNADRSIKELEERAEEEKRRIRREADEAKARVTSNLGGIGAKTTFEIILGE